MNMLDNVKGLLGKCWKDITPDLEPGRHFIDEEVTVHLHGSVEKGEDQMVAPTVSIPLVPTLALLIEKSGITGDHALRMLKEAILEAMNDNTSNNKAIQDRIKDVEKSISAVKQQLIQKLPKMHRSGRVVVKDLQVEVSQQIELVETAVA
jgi:hypothetical protein